MKPVQNLPSDFHLDSFILYSEWERHITLLSDAQAGQLLRDLFAFAARGEEPQADELAVKVAFSFMCAAMMENHRRYEQIKQARSKAGKAGAKARDKNTSSVPDSFFVPNDTKNDINGNIMIAEHEESGISPLLSPFRQAELRDAASHPSHLAYSEERELAYIWGKEEMTE